MSDTDQPSFTMDRRRMITFGAIGVLFVVFLGGVCGYNGVRKEAINKERSLNAQYRSNQNELSSYKAGAREQFSVAVASTNALNTIIEDAVKGRYEGDTGAQPTGGALFSAIVEAYPNLDRNTGIYERIVDYIQGKREAYKNVQNKLLDMIADYENYLSDSIFRQPFLSNFPSNRLEARIGNNPPAKGEAALEEMKRIVLTAEASKAYESGEEEPLDFSGNPE